jgi:Na+/melibiose symporter-like transporter
MDYSSLTDVMSTASQLWYLWLIVALIPAIIMGIFTAKLAKKKGYRGYFFTGFFFSMIGLIYVVGLPLSKDRAD